MFGLSRSIKYSTLTVLVVAAGCGSGEFGGDGASGALDTDGNDTGATANPSTDGATGDSGGGATGGGATTGGDTGDAVPEGACADVACGAGACVEVDGVPACDCDAGYADIGLQCAACDVVQGNYQVDMVAVGVRGAIKINGNVPPTSQYEDGNLLLRNRGTGDTVSLGSTRDDLFEVNAVAGRYDLVYSREDGGSQVPVNSRAVLDTIDIAPDLDSLIIDIDMVGLTGVFTIDGAPPPVSQYETGAIVLVNPATGDEVMLGQTRDQTYAVHMIPGVYEIHYRRTQGGEEVPLNGDAVLGVAEIMNLQGEIEPILDVDIQTIAATGMITVNEVAPPTSQYDDGNLVLRDLETSDEVVIGNTRDGSYQARLVAASYEVFYRAEDALGGGVPVNENALLGTVSLTTPTPTDIDIPMVFAGGQFTLDGQAPPASVYDSGVVALVDSFTDDRAVLGSTHSGTFLVPVVAGIYDVEYGVTNTTGLMPANTHGLVATQLLLEIDSDTNVDIETIDVSGVVTLNGQPPPGSEYEDGRLFLRSAETDDHVLLGSTHDGAFSRLVVPGVYAVHYGLENGGEDVPINGDEPVLLAVDVAATNQVDVSIAASLLAGSTVVNGAPAPGSAADTGDIVLRSVSTADEFVLGSTHAGSFAEWVTAGTYVVEYRATNPGALMPLNVHAGLACIEIP